MPPFKSEAQRRKIAQLEKEGKVKPGTTKEWASKTHGQLPERVTPKPKKPGSIKEIEEIRVKRFGK